MARHRRTVERVLAIFSLLADAPQGLTQAEIAEQIDVNPATVKGLIQVLRDNLGDDDTLNVPCDPDPANPGGPWRYHLVGSLDEVRPWAGNRLGDTERRIRTQYQVISSIAAGSDPASKDGRRARVMRRGLGRLLEDLDDLTSE